MTVFALLRHAESGTPGQYYGRTDVPLTPNGREVEAALLPRLATHPFGAVICSPLQRCRHLAMRAAEAAGLPLAVEPDLSEIDLGDWEGRTFDEASNIYAEIAQQLLACDPTLSFPGGESLQSFRQRVMAAWGRLCRQHERTTGPVLVVTHGGVIRTVLAAALELGPKDFWQHAVQNASLTLLEHEAGITQVLTVGANAEEGLGRLQRLGPR